MSGTVIKTALALLGWLVLSGVCHAQAPQIIHDPKMTAALGRNHAAEMAALVPMAEAAKDSRKHREAIARMTGIVAAIRKKHYDAHVNVPQKLAQGRMVRVAQRLATGITEFLKEAVGYVKGNPWLMAQTLEGQAALLSETLRLTEKLSSYSLTGGDNNLLSPVQRAKAAREAIAGLRRLHAIAYGVARKAKMAARAHRLRGFSLGQLAYPNQDAAIVSRLLNNL